MTKATDKKILIFVKKKKEIFHICPTLFRHFFQTSLTPKILKFGAYFFNGPWNIGLKTWGMGVAWDAPFQAIHKLRPPSQAFIGWKGCKLILIDPPFVEWHKWFTKILVFKNFFFLSHSPLNPTLSAQLRVICWFSIKLSC